MDPALQELYESGSKRDEVSIILRLEPNVSAPDGVRIVARFGPIVTARVLRGDIPRTWDNDHVFSMKAPRPVTPQAPFEDQAADESSVFGEAANSRPSVSLPEDGSGVLVGVCDWGIDFTHPNFRHPDGSTRLRMVWDQRGHGDPSAPAPYNYGRLHTREAINAALATSDPCATLGYHPQSGDPNNTGSHGTHVTDIAAGNRREPGSVVGLASGSELLFVHLAAQRLHELENLGDSISLLEGLDMIRRQAAGQSCVMHLSAGKTAGPHRGDTPVEVAVDAMLAGEPGLVLVQSVGNYADTAMHAHARIGPSQTYKLDWLIPRADRTPNELEIWYSGQDVFDVTLVAPDGQRFTAALDERNTLRGAGGEAWGNLYHRKHEPNSGMNHIDIFLYPAAPANRWQVVVYGREVFDGRFHAWIERDVGRHQSRFSRQQASPRFTTNTICNSFRAIAVGAYDATKPERPAARFSSRGPTADGRQKPELVAPGYQILAARSLPRDGWQGERKLCVKSGTSMAAPWVSGTVALMMQAAGRPLTINEVRRLVIGSADPHQGPEGRSSSRLGYGYLNVAAAVAAARALALQPPAAAGPAAQPFEELTAFESEPEFAHGYPPIWVEDGALPAEVSAPLTEEEEVYQAEATLDTEAEADDLLVAVEDIAAGVDAQELSEALDDLEAFEDGSDELAAE